MTEQRQKKWHFFALTWLIFAGPITYTVEPVHYGHLRTNIKCPDYQGVLIFQVSLSDKASFETITLSVEIMQMSLFSSVLINRFHCTC